jgi:YD repeat-containing protein
MRQKFLIAIGLLSGLFSFFTASAQYPEVLTPLKPEEQKQYQSLHVKMEKREATGNTHMDIAENRVRLFSPEGYLLGQFTYHKRDYFLYNENGQVSRAVDSVMTGDNTYQVHKYSILYGPSGKPMQMVDNKQWSTFTYDAASRTLTQTLSQDSPATIKYTYDASDRLIRTVSLTTENVPLTEEVSNYTKLGRLYSICSIDNSSPVKDSIIIYHFYNPNGSLQSRQVFETHRQKLGEDDRKPTIATHEEAGIYEYKYDAKGRLSEMDFTSPAFKPKNYTVKYTYNDNGLLNTETYTYFHIDPLIYKYSYTYYQ